MRVRTIATTALVLLPAISVSADPGPHPPKSATPVLMPSRPDPADRQWMKITLEHIKPSELSRRLPASERDPSGLPPRSRLLAYDQDNSVLVRVKEGRLPQLRALIALWDVPQKGKPAGAGEGVPPRLRPDLPPGARPFEFNGGTYYRIPLQPGRPGNTGGPLHGKPVK